jgi:hypothetical protein
MVSFCLRRTGSEVSEILCGCRNGGGKIPVPNELDVLESGGISPHILGFDTKWR